MSVVGIIFSNIHDNAIPELTKLRTMASVPFGCRYRLIDFALSNMVHGGINHIGVVPQYNYQSLMDHIGSGKEWDLARRSGGLQILPPYITAYAASRSSVMSGRLDALKNILPFISGCTEEYVALCDCDVVCNIDMQQLIDDHIASGADATLIIRPMYLTDKTTEAVIVTSDTNGRMTSVSEYGRLNNGYADVSTNIWIFNRRLLEMLVSEAISHNQSSLYFDMVQKNLERYNFRTVKYDGFFAAIDSMETYYICSMDLLNERIRHSLFNVPGRPIFTKVRNSPPTVYSDGACVRNSLIADGCVINGTVENSVLFRGVTVGRNTVVKNCILMQDTIVGESVTLNAVITDKNAVIRDGRLLSGHETLPFYIGKFAQI